MLLHCPIYWTLLWSTLRYEEGVLLINALWNKTPCAIVHTREIRCIRISNSKTQLGVTFGGGWVKETFDEFFFLSASTAFPHCVCVLSNANNCQRETNFHLDNTFHISTRGCVIWQVIPIENEFHLEWVFLVITIVYACVLWFINLYLFCFIQSKEKRKSVADTNVEC